MARTGKVAVSITADADGLQRGLRGAQGDLSRFGQKGEKTLHGLKTAAVGASTALVGGLVYGLKESVEAAIESEKSNAKLKAQLKALGTSYRAHAKEIDNVIQKTSALTGLDDEDLQDAFTAIVRSTGSVNTALKDMALVSDLARAKHMDVAKAGELVAKVHAGNVGVLKRMGIAIEPVTFAQDALKESTDEATDAQKRAAKATDVASTAQRAMGELQTRLAGQAEAYGKTTAGSADRFKVALENLKETIGTALLPTISKLADKAATFVNQMQEGTGAGGRFVQKLKDIYNAVKPVVEFFTKHPKYVAVAVGAWVAYRTAAAAALAATRIKALAVFSGLGKRAAAEGTTSGVAFAGGGGTTKAGFLGTASKLLRGFGWATIALAVGEVFGINFGKAFKDVTGPTIDETFDSVIGRLRGLQVGKYLDAQTNIRQRGQVPGPHGWQTPKKPGASKGGGHPEKQRSAPRAGTASARQGVKGARASSSSVRAHTSGMTSLQIAGMIANRFGLTISSGYRSPQHNAAVGGVPNSWHTRGTPSNPGAVDLVGSVAAMNAASAWASANVSGLAENMVHDAGSGLHLHLAFSGASVNSAAASSSGSPSASRAAAPKPKPPTALEKFTGRADLIGLRESAGVITSARADYLTVRASNKALHGGFGKLSRRGRLEVKTTRRDARSGLASGRRAAAGRAKSARADWKRALAHIQSGPMRKVKKDLALVDLVEARGSFTEQQADMSRLEIINRALGGFYGPLRGSDINALSILKQDIQAKYATSSDTASADPSADQAAQLDQANLRAYTAQRAAAIAGQELSTFRGAGDIGYGANVIVLRVGEKDLGHAVVGSLDAQPGVRPTRLVTGA